MSEGEANKVIDSHVDALMEHFESVHILVSFRTDGGDFTVGLSRGGGNFYARKGMIYEWIEEEKAKRIRSEISS